MRKGVLRVLCANGHGRPFAALRILAGFLRGSEMVFLAEDRGFEPLRALTQPAFQASAIGH